MNEDPVIFADRDRGSLAIGAAHRARLLGRDMSSARLLSWGNHPPSPDSHSVPLARRPRESSLAQPARKRRARRSPMAQGLSYGDSCLAASDHVLHVRPLDRFIGADWTTGVLAAEAGVTLEEVLAVAIPRGWFLPVTPGTKYVTLGGAVANDVHGKNHHRQRHIRASRPAVRPGSLGRRRALRARLENKPISSTPPSADSGLRAIIEWVEVQLVPIRASQVDCVTHRGSATWRSTLPCRPSSMNNMSSASRGSTAWPREG